MSLNFEEWMEEVGKCLDMLVGIELEVFPDQPYRDWFDDGISPVRAAKMAIEREEE